MLVYYALACLLLINALAFSATIHALKKEPNKKFQAVFTLFIFAIPLIYVADQLYKQWF